MSKGGKKDKSKRRREPVMPPPEPRSTKALALCVVALIGLLAADLGTKAWAMESLSTESAIDMGEACVPDEQGRIAMQRVRTDPIVVIDDIFAFRYAENCGAAFGLMRNAPPLARKAVFGIAAIVASIALMVMFVRGRGGTLFAISVPLIVSGAVGNLVDRVRYGYVIDFIDVVIFGWDYPVFNIADCGITVGVALLVIDGFRDAQRQKKAEAESREQAEKQAATAE